MIYAFYTLYNSINNNSNVVNPIGELSERGLTYALDVKHYSGTTGSLTVFDHDDGTVYITNNMTTISTAISAKMDEVQAAVVATDGTLASRVTTALGNNVSSVALGASVLNPVDNKLYPSFITFVYTAGGNDIPIKIWLANTNFLADYPLGVIKLVYPIANLQSLYSNYAQCKTAVNNLSPTALISKAAAQINYQVTGFTTFNVTIHNHADNAQSFVMPVFVGYNGGVVFCNNANYLIQMIADVQIGSTYTLEDWVTVIPFAIPVNRYYIAPNWSNAAITNSGINYPICSPTILPTNFDESATVFFPSSSPQEITDFLNYSVALYKSIGLFILPDANNLDGRVSWLNKFRDYFIVTLNDSNVDQMSNETKNVSILLDQLLRVAETYQEGVTLDGTMIVETYEGMDYICKTVEATRLCILTRAAAMST